LEGDLICGSKNSFIVTLVERHSRFVMLVKVANRDTKSVVGALIKQARTLPDELYKSLTWDRAKNSRTTNALLWRPTSRSIFAILKALGSADQTKTPIVCCASTCQRGSISRRTHRPELNKIARQLNERPRKTLDYESPAERFNECVASTR